MNCSRNAKPNCVPKAAFDEDLEVGIMIEIPSAALTANGLGERAKFFSIGTNDLIEYTFAVDRLNEKVADLYDPTHPALLRLLQMTIEAGQRHGIWTGVCGEMAGDPAAVPLLIGLGVDELSVAPTMLPQIKYLIRRLKHTETQARTASARMRIQCGRARTIPRPCAAGRARHFPYGALNPS